MSLLMLLLCNIRVTSKYRGFRFQNVSGYMYSLFQLLHMHAKLYISILSVSVIRGKAFYKLQQCPFCFAMKNRQGDCHLAPSIYLAKGQANFAKFLQRILTMKIPQNSSFISALQKKIFFLLLMLHYNFENYFQHYEFSSLIRQHQI